MVLMLVLVVDDDPAIRRLVVEVLKEEGFAPVEAQDGAEALELLANGISPAAIVLDLSMPNMDGRTFLRQARSRGLPTPVLIMSAYGAQRAMAELEADDALQKPFDIDELARRVRTLVERSAAGLSGDPPV